MTDDLPQADQAPLSRVGIVGSVIVDAPYLLRPGMISRASAPARTDRRLPSSAGPASKC